MFHVKHRQRQGDKMINNRIILASASPRRKEILERFGFKPEVIVAHFDEHQVHDDDPHELVKKLSYGKASAVRSEGVPGDIIIGSDTIVVVDGQIYGKPIDEKEAFHMIRSFAGRAHEVCTGVTVIYCGKAVDKSETFCEITYVHVTDMSDDQIREYVATGEPMDKAGAYGIQGKFGRYIDRIDGDVYAVMGLAGARTCEAMERLIANV